MPFVVESSLFDNIVGEEKEAVIVQMTMHLRQ